MFFSFDGVDGAGKSTQMDLFCEALRKQGRELLVCRDPGSTPLGERLRAILLERSDLAIDRRSEMLLYMAARAQLVEEAIRPALAEGKTVVCDRYLLANLVYQGHAGKLDLNDVRTVGRITTAGCMPDLTFVFDLPVTAALARMNRPLDRMESQGTEFLERVRSGFLAEAKVYPAPVRVIDAARTIAEIHAEIMAAAAATLAGSRSV